MKEETFLGYASARWLWICMVILAVLVCLYIYDTPIGGRNGGTLLGYSYGILAALAMVFLTWFGARKRSYYSTSSTLKGWLSAHVWIGIALIFLVPLHCAFSFGINVHTLAYALMVVTIVSGIWGAVMYVRLPALMKARRDGITLKGSLSEIDLISTDIGFLAKGKGAEFLKLLNLLDFSFQPSLLKTLMGKMVKDLTTRADVGAALSALPKSEYDDGLKVVSLAHKKTQLCNQLIEEGRVAALLKIWLYFHVPLAFASMAALVIHILSVFYYW